MLRQQDGVTVLLTTHFLEEADACDRVAILDHGRLVAFDTPPALKREVGGEVLLISARDPEKVSAWVRETWKVEPTLADGRVEVSAEKASEGIARLMAALPDEIAEVTVRRPTLEDVFLRKTGHRFWDDRSAAV
jgi:ABC-2 type transport system ATP-binding protein